MTIVLSRETIFPYSNSLDPRRMRCLLLEIMGLNTSILTTSHIALSRKFNGWPSVPEISVVMVNRGGAWHHNK